MEDWQTLRNHFLRETGSDFPGRNLEAQLVEAYADNPARVEAAVEKIVAGYKAGKVRSPWGALKSEVERSADPTFNPKHDEGATKAKAIQRAEQLVRNALLHYDREDEVLDELFGDQGILRAHDTPDARLRMILLWSELQPLGAATELEQETRLARYAAHRKELTCRPSTNNSKQPSSESNQATPSSSTAA